MVSTVTVTTIAAMGLVASLSVFGVILLITSLVSKELLSASNGPRKKVIARALNISIVPLLLSFTVIVALKVIEILSQ
jgi:hypothetical protein